MAKITINGITIDPQVEGPALAAANLVAVNSSESDYILIQTKQPLNKVQKAELGNLGVVILEYVPDETYLCSYPDTDLNRIRSLGYVTWANVYLQGFKVPASLKPESAATGRALASPTAELVTTPSHTLDTTPKLIDVVFHSNVDPSGVRDKLAAVVQLDPADLNLRRGKVRLTVAANQLNDVAQIDEVRHVEEVVPMKLHNNIARRILNVEPASNPAADVDGSGQVVAVCDTGFDTGSTTNVHGAFTNRVDRLYALGRATANDPNGHGTHVAGSVLGDGNSAVLGHTIRGTAPGARLVLQSVLDAGGGLGGLPDDLNDLFEIPYQNDNARVHTNSWGSTLGDGRYNTNSHEVDAFVWEHRDCVICFAAGNEGTDENANGVIDPRSITPPGTAKNCITIGASENDRPNFTVSYQQAFAYPADPVASDQMANNPDGMVAFSSRGPTTDGRIKPDIVAPGSFILSARSRDTSSSGWGATQDPRYYFNGGTSMATPLVAGCAAMIREFLAAQHQMTAPSAALVKALLINGATDIAGQYVPSEAGGIPNHSEGFGRVDMAATLDATLRLNDEATALDTGDEDSITVSVSTGAALKATLVWTDPPGATLQNDLDLIIRASDRQERHGNKPANSATFDRNNNVEQLVWDNVPAGDVDVVVRAHRVSAFAQNYALVIRVEGGAAPREELVINGPEALGNIGPGGEQDLYTLNVTTAGTYTIETSGTTDTFLTLFGPNDETTLVAADDDSGPGTLSQLVEDLLAGIYLVQVRHFSPRGSGPYGIAVRSHADPGAIQLQVNGPEVHGDIGQPAESDLYSFTVTSAGDHVIETSGSTDTFVSLFGPDSETTVIAQDDDSGPSLLSKVERSLGAGTYFVRVRHFSQRRTGAYGVRVRRV